MNRESIEKFVKFISEDKERQAKAKSFGNDPDALSAYARELGYDVSPQDLRELRESSRKFMEARMKKAQHTEASLSPGVRELYALLDLAETDKEVEKRLEELSAGTREDLIAYGKEKGFTFGEQDIHAVGKDVLEPSDELSEEELELVAGGIDVAVALCVLAVFGVLATGCIVAALIKK